MFADSLSRFARRLAAPAFFGLYLAAMAVASRGSAWVALPLLAMAWLAWQTEEEARLKKQGLWLALALSVSAVGLAVLKHQELAAQRRFTAYLKAHGCRPAGSEVRYAPGAAGGRYQEDAEPFEYDEAVFHCAATGRSVTFSDFEAGGFGQ